MLTRVTRHVLLSAGCLMAVSTAMPIAAGQDLSPQTNAVLLQPSPLQTSTDPASGASIALPASQPAAVAGVVQDLPGAASASEVEAVRGTSSASATAELSVNVSAEPADSTENRPATSDSSAPAAVADSIAAALLQEALAPSPADADSKGTEQRLPLLLVIERAGAAGQHLPAVQAYWRASIAQAELFYAERSLERVRGLTDPADEHSAALLASARAQAAARRERAALELAEAQTRLAEFAALPLLGLLPRTADVPLVGPYRTRFESLVVARSLPLTLHRIHRLLPHQLALLEAQARSVRATEDAVASLATRYAATGTGIEDLLDVMQKLGEQQQSFLATVRTYNDSIAEYALGVAGPGLTASTIVGMLVKTEITDTTVSVPVRPADAVDASSVQPASATTSSPPDAVRIPAGWEAR